MLATGEVSSMVSAQEFHMSDLCTLYTYSGMITGTDGQLSPYFVTGSSICGFLSVKMGKIYRGQLIIPEYDAEIRMPVTGSLDSRSMIKVSDITYEIDGIHHGRTADIYFVKELDIDA